MVSLYVYIARYLKKITKTNLGHEDVFQRLITTHRIAQEDFFFKSLFHIL